ncbi:uncharacterized protein LOC102510635 isoform X3 [Camelus ferus]|uniref:Uncharacterized protein LOC102510635 isoform X3 n=1 Tax=Camelus ferus TaxID=419612 RepID=A0A8B8STZ5_CAMFR|nr:uncharacterized protein LOC102510635 isoform X3 [Camelus ferus]
MRLWSAETGSQQRWPPTDQDSCRRARTHSFSSTASRVNGTCVPVMTVANKTKRKFQYLMEYGGQKRIFLEEVDPKSYVIFCTHHKEHGKETVVVTLFSKCRRPHPPGHHPHPPDRAGQAPRQGHPARCGSPGKTPGHSQQDPGGTPGTWRPLGSRRALNTR